MARVWHHNGTMTSHCGAKYGLHGSTWHNVCQSAPGCARVRQGPAEQGVLAVAGRPPGAGLERGARFCDLMQEAVDVLSHVARAQPPPRRQTDVTQLFRIRKILRLCGRSSTPGWRSPPSQAESR